MSKLVIKGRSENAEFPSVASADYPRIALADGSYIPLAEDDSSAGATLKIRLGDKIYRPYVEQPATGADWEVSMSYAFSPAFGLVSVDSNYEAQYLLGGVTGRGVIDRDLLKSDMYQNGRTQFSANQALVARQGNTGSLSSFSAYAENDVIQTYTSGYEQIVVAKKNANVVIPCEIGVFWYYNSSAQGCILKRDGTVIPWSQPNVFGEVLAFNYQAVVRVDREFTGTLKYYTLGVRDGLGARWVEVPTPVTDDLAMDTMMVFAFPS